MQLTADLMKSALTSLDILLNQEKDNPADVTLIIGGGGAMLLAHHFTLATSDIDAVPRGIEMSQLDPFIKRVAMELGLAPDWLNPYFATFSHTLPSDYGTRLIPVFQGKRIKALALGKEEMLIMKCFAHRQKDVGHAKALIKAGADHAKVGDHIESLLKKKIPGAQQALDFLDDVLDQVGG